MTKRTYTRRHNQKPTLSEEELAELRRLVKVTQEQLDKRADFSSQHIKRGTKHPMPNWVKQIGR